MPRSAPYSSHGDTIASDTASNEAKLSEADGTACYGTQDAVSPSMDVGGVGSLLLWAEAAVGVDVGLTFFSSNRQALVTLNGGTGQWHRIEVSTNLMNWRPVTNLCLTNPASAWLDTGASNYQQRFYQSQQLTPLDLYVATPDTNYGYTVLKTNVGAGQTTYVLELRS